LKKIFPQIVILIILIFLGGCSSRNNNGGTPIEPISSINNPIIEGKGEVLQVYISHEKVRIRLEGEIGYYIGEFIIAFEDEATIMNAEAMLCSIDDIMPGDSLLVWAVDNNDYSNLEDSLYITAIQVVVYRGQQGNLQLDNKLTPY
jgi:hypothetical protein